MFTKVINSLIEFSTFVLIAFGLFSLIGILPGHRQDYSELFTGYDDRISFIVEGYQMHGTRLILSEKMSDDRIDPTGGEKKTQ